MSYYSSRYYGTPKPVVRDSRYDTTYHARDSSSDSHGSYYGRSSTGSSSRSSAGHSASAEQRAYDEYHKQKHRVPDNDRHAITSKTREGVTVNHKQARYDPSEPRASDATSTHYKSSQARDTKPSKSSKHR